MATGTNLSTIGRFGAFVVRHLPHPEDRPWPQWVKVALWAGLAAASWGIVIAVGYSIWNTL